MAGWRSSSNQISFQYMSSHAGSDQLEGMLFPLVVLDEGSQCRYGRGEVWIEAA